MPSDVELDEGSGASVGSDEPPDEISDGDWNMMGAALEREFLEGDWVICQKKMLICNNVHLYHISVYLFYF